MGRDDDVFEMTRAQRKRAPTLEAATEGTEDSVTSSTDDWQVVSSADVPDIDPDDKSKRKRTVNAIAARRGFAQSCLSSQTLVAVGLAWCAVVALLLTKWLWFYTAVIKPLEASLGKQLSSEAEPFVVAAVLVAPFVVTGLVFYSLEPKPLQLHTDRLPSVVRTLRWRRRESLGGRLDSVDVTGIAVFALVQLTALVGKLMIDQYNGKIAKSGYLKRGGRALGMNGFYAVLLSIVLVSRQSFMHQFLRLSSERAAQYHVWCGNFGAIALMVHGIVYTYIWTVEGKLVDALVPCFDCDKKKSYKAMRNFAGLVAQVMLIAVALASLERVRRQHFRRFTLVHGLNVVFVLATCVHYYPAAYWFVAPLLGYIMYRVVSVFARTRSGVASARSLGDAIIQLELKRDNLGLASGGFVPGQYVYMKVDEISKYEWHPFTISSSPLRHPTTLTLDIKVQGPFTKHLLELVQSQSLNSVQVDGYYGTPIEVSSDMVMIAGGSGFTPFLSALEHFVHLAKDASNRQALPERLWIVWTARDLPLLHAYKPLLDQVRHCSAWRARVWLHCTGEWDDDGSCEAASTIEEPKTHGSSPTMIGASFTRVFGAVAAGAVGAMLLVHSTSVLKNVWWVKRLSLIVFAAFGALAGGAWILWRALPHRAGFERVDTSDTPKVAMVAQQTLVKSAAIASTLVINRIRPDIESVLREVHAAVRDESRAATRDVLVLVSGPSELQQRVVEAGVAFQAPFLSVERRSFAL